MEYWGITDKGAVRRQNQDAYQAGCIGSDGLGFAVVCDGMGGALAGNVASNMAVDRFWDEVAERCAAGLPDSPEQVLRDALDTANEEVYHRSCRDRSCQGMGTTLVSVLTDGRRAWVLNVGDSRCYLAAQDSIRQISQDHSLVEMLVSRGEITPEQARTHPRKNLITRALGVECRITPDVFTLDCPEGSCFLLCSDGLSNQVTSEEILCEITQNGPPDTCCRRLLEIALKRGAPDNVTAVLLRL